MYVYDIQFKLLHSRVATNTLLFKMQITDTENCEFCGQIETIEHAFDVWKNNWILEWSKNMATEFGFQKGPVLVYYTNYPIFSSFMNLTKILMIM